jgi:hypothetical protein
MSLTQTSLMASPSRPDSHMRSRARAYRWDKLRRAFTRTAENNAPAPPTSASTAVGFSGQ